MPTTDVRKRPRQAERGRFGFRRSGKGQFTPTAVQLWATVWASTESAP